MTGRVLRVLCAWCGRQKMGDRWIPQAAVGARAGATGYPSEPVGTITSHGICPDCAKGWGTEPDQVALLEALRERRPARAAS